MFQPKEKQSGSTGIHMNPYNIFFKKGYFKMKNKNYNSVIARRIECPKCGCCVMNIAPTITHDENGEVVVDYRTYYDENTKEEIAAYIVICSQCDSVWEMRSPANKFRGLAIKKPIQKTNSIKK